MRKKKKKLNYRKERVVLSDVLPYEVPATFSNRYFYRFLINHDVEYARGSTPGKSTINWKEGGPALERIIRLIFGVDEKTQKTSQVIQKFDRSYRQSSLVVKGPDLRKAPYKFRISHKGDRFRELAICHPVNQLQVIEFYHSHKELLIYSCSASPYSIRRPHRVAQYTYHRDKTHYDALSEEIVSVEEEALEYENLRSFFVFKDYSNVYKFYESYKFHRAEKKYDKLLRLDVSKCFESIYSHSVTWAIFGKECVKYLRQQHSSGETNSFAGQFDRLMQGANFGETNGILIGPEFSRIFAEVILQAIDVRVEANVRNREFVHKRHYEVFRYVDDYFVFFNEDAFRDVFFEELTVNLAEYKLHLNEGKQELLQKPIITPITIAKSEISELFKSRIKITIEEKQGVDPQEPDLPKVLIGKVDIRSNYLKTAFKAILRQTGVEYSDVMNWALTIVEKQTIRLIKGYKKTERSYKSERSFTKSIRNVIDFTFFIYAVAPRVNTTIKLARILSLYIAYFQGKSINPELKSLVFDEIFENISMIINKNKSREYSKIETLYLLLVVAELGNRYRLPEAVLCNHLGISVDNGFLSAPRVLSHFEITVLLCCIKDKVRYARLRDFLESQILENLVQDKSMNRYKTDSTILLFDTISCPYVSQQTKRDALELFGVSSSSDQDDIVDYQSTWFTNWHNRDLSLELEAKRSRDVY